MSNPYYRLLFMWRGFVVSFYNNIMAPAWAKLAEDGNAKPIMVAGLAFVPVMLVAEMFRDMVRNFGDDDGDEDYFTFERPRWKNSWDFFDHLAYAVKRSGFYGNHELVTDVLGELVEDGPREAVAEAGGVFLSDINKGLKGWGWPVPGGDLMKGWG
jgi:hypothetical protein